MESVNELNRYYYGEEEPPYEFIEKLCKVLGINEKWMKFGKDTPYRNELRTYYHAEEMLEEISSEKEILFFTIKELYRRELGVIVKKDTYIFNVILERLLFMQMLVVEVQQSYSHYIIF